VQRSSRAAGDGAAGPTISTASVTAVPLHVGGRRLAPAPHGRRRGGFGRIRRRPGEVPAPVVVVGSYVAGALPVMYVAARLTRGVDLRTIGTGTVSGTGLHQVAGFPALAVAGVVDVAKGAIGPALAGGGRPSLQALAAAASITGHNWSVFLHGAGGRGIAPTLGTLVATEPMGLPVLLGGLAAGRLVHQSGIGTLVGLAGLAPTLSARRGSAGRLLLAGLATPMLLKRLLGNATPPPGSGPLVYLWRLLLDRDRP
jgi:glycerol-3-phosphate acyltransferase PlsY